MKSKFLWWVLGILGGIFLISSLTIAIMEYQRFQSQPAVFPAGSLIAGVPVGGLSPAEAETRLAAYYSLPLELQIDQETIQATPADLGFRMDAAALVQVGLEQLPTATYWQSLWNKAAPEPVSVPLKAAVDREQLRTYLAGEIAPRYSQPGAVVTPIPFTTNFNLSSTGTELDMDQAISAIEAALLSPGTHSAALSVTPSAGGNASLSALEAFLQHNINWIGFDGLVEVYLDPLDGQEPLHFAVQGDEIVTPDVAFTAASTIKIPIMVSVLRHLPEPTPEEVVTLLEQMIALSENAPADTLMEYYLDPDRGPLIVTEDMTALGFENTFLAGYFYPGAPLLQWIETPANTRQDIYLNPDDYNQVVASEAGRLMAGIYHCAADGSGLLAETFPGEITPSECQLILQILSESKPVQFIDAGLPPETRIANKYGYVIAIDGLLHTASDIAIVFTEGGDYVLNIFIHDPEWLDYEVGVRLMTRLSQTVYNFFNLENQVYWWFD